MAHVPLTPTVASATGLVSRWPQLRRNMPCGTTIVFSPESGQIIMPRRDTHREYAADDLLKGEKRGDIAPPAASREDGLLGNGSLRTTTPRRASTCCEQDAHGLHCGRVGVPADDRGGSHVGAAGILGSLGPGAEPPVAVASHAFAHEEPRTEGILDCSQGKNQGTEAAPVYCNSSGSEGTGGVSAEVGNLSQKHHNGKEDGASSQPESTKTSNEEEVDTLPDSFNLSDEYGPEGASTGRNHRDDDDDDGSIKHGGRPCFFGLRVESSSRSRSSKMSRGQGEPSPGYCSRSNYVDVDSRSGFRARDARNGGGEYASASDSSVCSSASPERQRERPQLRPFGRCFRQSSRRPQLGSMQRSSRVVTAEECVEPCEFESEGARRHRRTSGRNSSRYRSPLPQRYRRDAEDIKHHRRRRRRGGGGRKSRDSRRSAITETEPMFGEAHRSFEAEMAELRRENEALKQQKERPTRLGDSGFDARPWKNRHDADSHSASMDAPPRSSRRRDQPSKNTRHRQRLTRENDELRAQQQLQHEERQRLKTLVRVPDPLDVDVLSVCSASRRRRDDSTPRPEPASWLDFVKNDSSPRSIRSAALGVEPLGNTSDGFDLNLPRVLVEGGFLWKVPYHNAGTPKRRWFQIKPAEGLLTTASGHLVVRPTAAGGGGSLGAGLGEWEKPISYSERIGDGGSRKDVALSMSMMRLRAAWPLAFIWVDPERDLKRSPPREMGIEEIVDLARGHKTPAFWQQADHRGIHTLPDPNLCFSLVGHDRTLDLAAESLPEAKEWVRALARVAVMVKRGGLDLSIGDAATSSPRSSLEPAAGLAHPDLEKKSYAEGLKYLGDQTISHVGVQRRQSDGAAGPFQGEPCQQDISVLSEKNFTPDKTETLGEGGAWSLDAILAWRRRLFPAVTRGDVTAVLAMFDQGCPVDLVQAGTGDTPMLLACRLGDVGMVRECLRRGSRNDPHPTFGQTALQAAVALGQEDCARLLLETAASSRSDAVVSNHKDPNKETPLHVACRRGYCGIVEALLHHGADLRAVDRKGNTPLHGAAGSGHAGALASLLDAGGDAVLEERNARGERALHAAAASGHIACVELLLGTAAEPDMSNADGQTPFALASRGGHLAVTRLIRQYAPAAGTPSGGDAQFQAHRRRKGGGDSPTTDTLPRPHASGPTSHGLGVLENRSRDLEHRCYSAAGLDHRQFEEITRQPSRRQSDHESGVGFGDGGLLRGTKEAERRHGSLFDGLQVYVVGGRQPLGSQHTSAAIAVAGMKSASSARATASARTMVLDSHRLRTSSHHYHHQREEPQQNRNTIPANQHASPLSSLSTASFSTGGLDPNWRDNVLSAPSTVAPSPPVPLPLPVLQNHGRPEDISREVMSAAAPTTPTGGDLINLVTAPGGARALARMIHFSNNHNNNDRTGNFGPGDSGRSSRSAAAPPLAFSKRSCNPGVKELAGPAVGIATASPTGGSGGSGGNGSGGDGDGETPTEAIGSWMTSKEHDQGSPSVITELGRENKGGGTDLASAPDIPITGTTEKLGLNTETKAVLEHGASGNGGTGREAVAGQGTENEEESFVLVVSDEVSERQGRGASAGLSGLWRVFQSEGYPYYLHEASGHSQWEDPREKYAACVQEISAEMGMVEDVGSTCLERRCEPKGDPAHVKEDPEKVRKFSQVEGEKSRPPRASPINPTGVSVAVTVARFAEATAASRSVTIASNNCRGAAASEFRGGQEELNPGRVDIDVLEEHSDRVGLIGTISSDCRSIASRNSNGADDASFTGDGVQYRNNNSTNINDSDNSDSDNNDSDNDYLPDVEDDITGPESHKSTNITTTKDLRCEGKVTDDEAGEKLWHPVVEADGSRSSLPACGEKDATALFVDELHSLNVRSLETIAKHFSGSVVVDNGTDDGDGDSSSMARSKNGLAREEEDEWWQEVDDETGGEKNMLSPRRGERTPLTQGRIPS